MRQKIFKSVSEGIVVLLSLIVLVPLYMLIINSFKDKAGAAEMNMKLPAKWNILENYSQLVREANILTALRNSLMITVVAVTLIVVFSAMAGFIIQRKKNKSIGIINNIILFGLFFPGSIVPTYFITKYLHLGSYAGVICVYIATVFPVSVFLYTGFYKSISVEIDESAIIDGCGIYRLFFNIIFPLVKPVTITVIVTAFMTVWNDFSTAIYFLNNSEKYTLVLTTFFFFGQKAADWQLVFADIVVISIPVVLMYLMMQKHIVSGLTAGSVKG